MKELTPRETMVLKHISEGLGNDEIALKLNISKNTVRVYMKTIYEKLNINSRTKLTIYAIQQIRKPVKNKPKVTKGFVEKWAYEINDVWAGKIREKDFIIKLLTEAGVEVEE